MIFGRPGSGKSTFALKLASTLNIPLLHVDKYFFKRNWETRDTAEFIAWQQGAVAQPEWIIDGNAMRSLEIRYQKADIALCFYLPLCQCMWRILKRRCVARESGIDDRAEDCREQVSLKLLYYIVFYKRKLQKLHALKQKYPATKLVYIRSDADAQNCLHSLDNFIKRSA